MIKLNPTETHKGTFMLNPKVGGGVQVLLRYFLTLKTKKRDCPLTVARVIWNLCEV